MIKKYQISNIKYQKKYPQHTTYNLQPRSGFTLIEIIIVMAIIAAITATVWGNFFTSITKGRDSRRKQDLQSVARALEIYYNDHTAYPSPPLPNWGESFVNEENSAVVYMSKLPLDPSSPQRNYCYESDGSGSYYKLYANLENANDTQILSPTQQCASDDLQYNYTLTSTNIES